MTGFLPLRKQVSIHHRQPRNNKKKGLGVVGTLRWRWYTAGIQSSGFDPVIGNPNPQCRWSRPERLLLSY